MSELAWSRVEAGATLGTRGSEEGVIDVDEEFDGLARITLEDECVNAPLAITCGIYGWMLHTRYFSTHEKAIEELEAMKLGLAEILSIIPTSNDPESDAKCNLVVETIQKFVARFP